MHLLVASADLAYATHLHGNAAPPAAPAPAKGAPPAAAGSADEHAGHGRRLLRWLASALLAPAPAPVAAAAKPAAPAGAASGAGHEDEDMAGMDMGEHSQHAALSGGFGPRITADVAFPKRGVYALVGQLRRGDELILLPFFVNCTGAPQGA
jgi:hypothetical protein